MPVIFSLEDREALHKQLKETAFELFKKQGIKKTTVSQLTKEVGIAKGTFYNFYESKEELVIAIMEDFNQKAEEKFRQKLQGRGKLPLMEAMEVYQTIFQQENSFFYHLRIQDVQWMKENLPKDVLFNPEADKKKAEYVLSFVDGVREDIDYGVVANFPKMIHGMLESKDTFCQEAIETNIQLVLDAMLRYVSGKK